VARGHRQELCRRYGVAAVIENACEHLALHQRASGQAEDGLRVQRQFAGFDRVLDLLAPGKRTALAPVDLAYRDDIEGVGSFFLSAVRARSAAASNSDNGGSPTSKYAAPQWNWISPVSACSAMADSTRELTTAVRAPAALSSMLTAARAKLAPPKREQTTAWSAQASVMVYATRVSSSSAR
jgi:hypothetical protein